MTSSDNPDWEDVVEERGSDPPAPRRSSGPGQEEEEDEDGELEQMLRSGLLDVYLERLIRRLLKSPMSADVVQLVRVKVSASLPRVEALRRVMDAVRGLDLEAKVDLLKTVTAVGYRDSCEKRRWFTYTVSGEEAVTSPRGRRKIRKYLEALVDAQLEVDVELWQQALWLVLYPRRQLDQLRAAGSRSAVRLSSVAVVWYPGEPALYTTTRSIPQHTLLSIARTLGYAQVRPIRLDGKRLSSMRLMFTAKLSGRYLDRAVSAGDEPLPF